MDIDILLLIVSQILTVLMVIVIGYSSYRTFQLTRRNKTLEITNIYL